MKVKALEESLRYHFQNPELLEEALSHPSLRQMGAEKSNGVLEFLGDAVLSLVLARLLLETFPQANEGFLTRARTTMVRTNYLAKLGLSLSLPDYLLVGKSVKDYPDGLLADTTEAVLGAVFMDGGYTAADDLIARLYAPLKQNVEENLEQANPKGTLQEYLQQQGLDPPVYTLLQTEGPSHQQNFQAQVCALGRALGEGKGTSLKKAEEQAARAALLSLRKRTTTL